MCFNATTAFLLPAAPGPQPAYAAVSMPPRRSCFRVLSYVGKYVRKRFNATTAFLLPTWTGR